MKKLSKNHLMLLPIGLLVLSASFILKGFVHINDFVEGLLKGGGIGFLFLSMMLRARYPKKT